MAGSLRATSLRCAAVASSERKIKITPADAVTQHDLKVAATLMSTLGGKRTFGYALTFRRFSRSISAGQTDPPVGALESA